MSESLIPQGCQGFGREPLPGRSLLDGKTGWGATLIQGEGAILEPRLRGGHVGPGDRAGPRDDRDTSKPQERGPRRTGIVPIDSR